jgi:hypothetical protein
MIDLTCTATLRPELLRITLDSHIENLFGDRIKDIKLIINIDKIGSNKNCNDALVEILSVIDKYPFKTYSLNMPDEPHFGRAFVWCMSQIEQKYFFNLEEDWKLLHKVDFDKMIELMQNDESIAHLRLSAFPSSLLRMKTWNQFINWNGKYFEVPADLKGTIGWCGHPSLNRTSFIKECLKFIDPNGNPEKQIKGRRYMHPANELIATSKFGVFHPKDKPAAIEDIGRKWMVENGWTKSGSKAFFTQWEKVRK